MEVVTECYYSLKKYDSLFNDMEIQGAKPVANVLQKCLDEAKFFQYHPNPT